MKMKKLTAAALALALIGASSVSALAAPIASDGDIAFALPENIQIVDPPTGAIGARGGNVHFGMVYAGLINVNTASATQILQAHTRFNEAQTPPLTAADAEFLGPSNSRNVLLPAPNPGGVNFRDDRFISITFTNPGTASIGVQLAADQAAFFVGMTGNPVFTMTHAQSHVQDLDAGATVPLPMNVMTFDRTSVEFGAARPFVELPGETAAGIDWTAQLVGNAPVNLPDATATLTWTVVPVLP